MAEIFLRRTLQGFAPADEDALETTRKYKVGTIYRAKVVKPRNYEHHKKVMALLSLTYHNLPEQHQHRWKSFNDFRYGVAIDAGHCVEIQTPSGEIFKRSKSIDYSELDEAEFSDTMPRFMAVCAELIGVSNEELEQELSEYAGQYGAVA